MCICALGSFKEIDNYDELQDINDGISFGAVLLAVVAVVVVVRRSHPLLSKYLITWFNYFGKLNHIFLK